MARYGWKGDNAGYGAVHRWVRLHKPKPDLCEFCNAKPSNHLANVTGRYNRDSENYRYLCQSCHQRYDFSKGIRKHSKEQRQKMREYKLGKKLSEETKLKISRNHADMSGKNNPFFGRRHSEETKKKIGSYHVRRT